MFNKKRNLLLVTIVIFVFILSLSTSAFAENLVFGHNDPVNSIADDAAHKFAEFVEEMSNGEFTVDVFPNNQLGTNRDLIEQTQQGSMDFTMGGIGNLGYIQPEYNMVMSMFVFENQQHMRNFVEGPLGKELAEKLIDKGLRMVSQTWDRFPRQIVSTRKIVEPEDMKGLVIRAGYPGAEVPARALGASPTRIPLAEMYTGFSQGVIEAVEMPWSYILGESLYEVADYVILTNNTYATRFFAMSEKTYQDMTPEQRKVIFKAAEKAGVYNNEQTWAKIEEYKEQLKEYGMEFVEPNREAMVEIVKGQINELEELWEIEGLYDKIQKYREAYRYTAPVVNWDE